MSKKINKVDSIMVDSGIFSTINPESEEVIIDSGAFSVWNKGINIDIDQYIDFCKEYIDVIDTIVALDVIPGEPNKKKTLTKKNIREACEKGWENYLRMIDGGLPKEKVMPVFHQNDEWKWLEKFMEEKIPYIGISPANDCDSFTRQLWLDSCMKIICDEKGMPLTKFHGFAVTSIPLMVRYPWYSVDSASWVMFSIYGAIMVPHKKPDGTWNYLKPPQKIFFSTKKGVAASEKGAHYDLLPPVTQKVLREYIEKAGAKIGVSKYRKEPRGYKHIVGKENIYLREEKYYIIEEIVEEGVSNTIQWRGFINKFFFEQVEKELKWPRPFRFQGRGLLV